MALSWRKPSGMTPQDDKAVNASGGMARRWSSLAKYTLFAAIFGVVVFQLRNPDRIEAVLLGLAEVTSNKSPPREIADEPISYLDQVVPNRAEGPPSSTPRLAQDFKTAADAGDAYAQFRTGVIFEFGVGGFALDAREAIRYYKLAADQGNLKAVTNLAMMYRKGEGIPADASEAVRLFKLAVTEGDMLAATNLGIMYLKGEGIPVDAPEAARLFQMAAAENDAVAGYYLSTMYRDGLGGLPKDEAWAKRLLEQYRNRPGGSGP